MDIIRVSMLGMCGVIMGFFLKGTRAEYTAFITMGIGIMILGLAVGKLEYLFQTLGNLQKSISVDQEYFYTLIKMVGITYIGQFSAGICKMPDIRQLRRRSSYSVNCRSWFCSMPSPSWHCSRRFRSFLT